MGAVLEFDFETKRKANVTLRFGQGNIWYWNTEDYARSDDHYKRAAELIFEKIQQAVSNLNKKD